MPLFTGVAVRVMDWPTQYGPAALAEMLTDGVGLFEMVTVSQSFKGTLLQPLVSVIPVRQ